MALAVVTAALVSGCGSDASTTEIPAANDAGAFFAAVDVARQKDVGSVLWAPSTLVESLPNHTFTVDGEELRFDSVPWTFSEAVVVGKVTDVEPQRARPPAEEEDLDGTSDHGDSTTGDENERWASAIVSVAVEDSVGQEVGDHLDIEMSLLGADDPEKVIAAIKALDHVLMVFDGTSDDGFYPVLQGALVGELDSKGHVSFPGLGREESTFVGSTTTTRDIFAAAAGPVVRQEIGGELAKLDG
jgi:hypothetical protein